MIGRCLAWLNGEEQALQGIQQMLVEAFDLGYRCINSSHFLPISFIILLILAHPFCVLAPVRVLNALYYHCEQLTEHSYVQLRQALARLVMVFPHSLQPEL